MAVMDFVHHMKSLFLTVICAVIAGSGTAFAQTQAAPAQTPREQFIDFLKGEADLTKPITRPSSAPFSDDIVSTTRPQITAPETLIDESVATLPPPNLLPAPEPAPEAAPEEAPEESMTSAMPDNNPMPTEEVTLITSKITSGDRIEATGRLPFYVSARDYLLIRDTQAHTRVELVYSIDKSNGKTDIKSSSTSARILIGPDYAAYQDEEELRLYDFKTNRRLTLTQQETLEGEILNFTNVSLFPLVLKKVETITRATQNGKLNSIKISPELNFDVFWMESALGFSQREAPKGLTQDRDDITATAKLGTIKAFEANLNGPDLPSSEHRDSWLALLYHEVAIHPQILAELTTDIQLPSALTYLTYGPALPDGVRARWTLDSHSAVEAPFPLPPQARSVLEQAQVAPLTYVIAGAANGSVLGGPPDEAVLREVATRFEAAGDTLSAYLTWQRLVEMQGGCPDAAACDDITTLTHQSQPTPELTAVIKAFTAQGSRIDQMNALRPLIKTDDPPPILLRKAGEIRSELTPRVAKMAGLSDILAGPLLEQALAKDPYDPKTYLSLAQIYTARGAFEESWDLRDALLVLPGAPQELLAPTTRAEIRLMITAPAFFQ